MTAISVLSCFKNIEVSPADKYVKYVFDDAAYMANLMDYTLVLIPSNDILDDIEDGMLYRYFMINGRLYESACTSSHNELLKLNITNNNDEIRYSIEQLSLF